MPLTRHSPLFWYTCIVELLIKIQMWVMDYVTQEHLDPNSTDSITGPEIQIEIQNLNSQIPSQSQGGGETNTGTASHQQAYVGVEGINFEAGPLPSQNETQAEYLKMGLRVAIWATQIAAGGVIAISAGFIGNQTTSSTHKLFFKASMISMCAAFVFGSCIIILKTLRPNIPCLIVIVKILMLVAMVSVAMVVGFGVTFYFRR